MARRKKEEQVEAEASVLAQLVQGASEQPPLHKTMISFTDAGIIISASDLRSVEKCSEMKETMSGKVCWKHGIIFNRGMSDVPGVMRGEFSVWYPKEETRDRKLEIITLALESAGVTIVRV